MSITIKVLGPGCPRCEFLLRTTEGVVAENGLDAQVSKVDDIVQILGYGVMSTPALVINERVVVSGRIPSKNEIRNYIVNATKGED